MQVVGKRHFGQKALPQGAAEAEGGRHRNFDTLLLWKGAIPLDEKWSRVRDRAPQQYPYGFCSRGTMAESAGKDLFGTGTGRLQTSPDVILTSGLPPIVHQGETRPPQAFS